MELFWNKFVSRQQYFLVCAFKHKIRDHNMELFKFLYILWNSLKIIPNKGCIYFPPQDFNLAFKKWYGYEIDN